jgi:hypothetical protein
MNQLCPGCHTKEETFCHVIQCTHPTTASHRDSALNTLTKTLQHIGTPKPILQDILSEFKLWLQSTTTASSLLVGSLKGPDILLSATFYEQYHEIGWYKLYLGRISSKWASMATPYDTSLDGDLWASHFISTLWIFLCSMWSHRNSIVHEETTRSAANSLLAHLHRQVQTHYDNFHQDPGYVLPCHIHLFQSRSLSQCLSSPPYSIHCWLRSVDVARISLHLHIHQRQELASLFFSSQNNASDS